MSRNQVSMAAESATNVFRSGYAAGYGDGYKAALAGASNAPSDTVTRKLEPRAKAQYDALLGMLSVPGNDGRVTRDQWYSECVRLGLERQVPEGASGLERGAITSGFRVRLSDLRQVGYVATEAKYVRRPLSQ